MSKEINSILKTTDRKALSRRESRQVAQDYIQNLNNDSHPNSEKIFIDGDIHPIKVAMRQIHQTDTFVGGTEENPVFEKNEPIPVYDISGPYTDPNSNIDVHAGLPRLREAWISARDDVETLDSVTSNFAQQRLTDDSLDDLRFANLYQSN